MEKKNVIAIFDVGKTNKKLLLFDEQYNVIHEESYQLQEIKDEDGFSCEDVDALTNWVQESFAELAADERFDIKAVNFSAYGASFVYLDDKGEVIAPLYNYLKPYPKKLQDQFYKTYGGESVVAKETADDVGDPDGGGTLGEADVAHRLRARARALMLVDDGDDARAEAPDNDGELAVVRQRRVIDERSRE